MEKTKKEVRAEVIERRRTVPFIERVRKSARICERVGEMLNEILPADRSSKKPVVALYSAMPGEVDLSELALGLVSHECRVAFPAMIEGSDDGRKSHMEFFEVSWDELNSSAESFLTKPLKLYTRAELVEDGFPYIAENEIDVVISPMVAFDNANRRLGYGGGNYDRLFAAIRPDTTVIGVAFDEQEVDCVPTDEYDIPLPVIVHE